MSNKVRCDMAPWTLKLGFDYSQIWVVDSTLKDKFIKWTRKHFHQGFAWMPGAASFRMLIRGGIAEVRILVDGDALDPSPDAIRIIEVPFEVPEHGCVEVGGFASRAIVDVTPGRYLLRYEAHAPDTSSECKIDLTFLRTEKPEFRIVRADPDLTIEGDLLTTAMPLRFPPGLADQPKESSRSR